MKFNTTNYELPDLRLATSSARGRHLVLWSFVSAYLLADNPWNLLRTTKTRLLFITKVWKYVYYAADGVPGGGKRRYIYSEFRLEVCWLNYRVVVWRNYSSKRRVACLWYFGFSVSATLWAGTKKKNVKNTYSNCTDT